MSRSAEENETVPYSMCEWNNSIRFEKDNTEEKHETTDGHLKQTFMICLKFTERFNDFIFITENNVTCLPYQESPRLVEQQRQCSNRFQSVYTFHGIRFDR